jgi:hypothetical protein
MRSVSYLLFLFFLGSKCLAQKNEYKVSSKDSLEVLNFWRSIVKALDEGDVKYIGKNSAAIVECYCGTDSLTNEINLWKTARFAPQFIKKYSISPKLKKVIETEVPKIMLSLLDQGKTKRIFSVVYVVDKPSKEYEGTSIFFDISKKGQTFKLKSIWTIP